MSDAVLRSAVLAVLTCFAVLESSADPHRVEPARWAEAVRTASAEKKPIVVFFRPANCAEKRVDPCAALEKRIAHPAMQRRLREVVFLIETMEAGDPAVAVHDPAGTRARLWLGAPDATDFVRMLNLVEIASPYLLTPSARSSALAALALGDEERGREGLEALLQSSVIEDRQLATIWLTRLTPNQTVDRLLALGEGGKSALVRFEAWMAAGDLQAANDRTDAAIAAYGRAAADAPSALNRSIALAALHRVTESGSPILGLGGPGELVFGRRTMQPRKVASSAAKVEIRLDGLLVATSKTPPFVTSANFGRIPKRQVLTMTAIDKSGNVVQRTEMVVNERSNAFSVQIVEPPGSILSGEVDVEIATKVPRGLAPESASVEWNGVEVARFTAPPYRTRVKIAAGETGILRAVLRLADGSETEDVRVVNSLDLMLETDVSLVEVPAYLDAAGVTADKLSLLEAGKPRAIDRLIPAGDTPLRIALVLDTSSSMADRILDLQEAAVQFVEKDVAPRDETMVIGFGSSLQILRPTRTRSLVERAILRLYARGATPLHDAMITALLRLQVSGSRRALIVFSDGMDTASVFSAGDVVEVARRIGVPIYVLSFAPEINLSSPRRYDRLSATAHGELVRLSRSSGGKAFRLRSLDELGKIWNEIGADLRKQSLVIYRTDPAGDEWRALKLSIRGGRSVRAPSGVYVGAER